MDNIMYLMGPSSFSFLFVNGRSCLFVTVQHSFGTGTGTVGKRLTDRPNGGTDRPYALHVSPTVTDTVHTREHA
jgi:hypothetical protein